MLLSWSPILTGILVIKAIGASPINIINHHQPVPDSSVSHFVPASKSFGSATADYISSYRSLTQNSLQPPHTLISTMKYIFSLIMMVMATSMPTADAAPAQVAPEPRHDGHHDGKTTTGNPDLVAKLRMAATMEDRAALLSKNEDWLFDFTAQPSYTYSPGSVVVANVASFPAAVGHGLTVSMLNLGPCAMLSPHLHPRAANWVTAVEGVTKTWMIQENGVKPIEVVLKPGQMTIFPAGSLHAMQNMGTCSSAASNPFYQDSRLT